MSEDAPTAPVETEFSKVRADLVREEVQRIRVAAWGLVLLALAIFAYLVWQVLGTPLQPSWEFITLLGVGCFCIAAPLIAKLTLSKEGGGVDLASPVALFDRLEIKAQAARAQSYSQISQQIKGLSQQVEELARRLDVKTGAAPTDAASLAEPSLSEIQLTLGRVKHPKDQQKGRFGATATKDNESNGARRLSATTSPSDLGRTLRMVHFTLASTNGKPLEGAFAYFFLHQTFDPDAYRVNVPPGAMEVCFEILAYGAFTAGVVAERGATRLEIDLETSPNVKAPKDWKAR